MFKHFPFATWLFGYQREWLSADVLAGLTTAAVVIPQTMAYAAIAGLPVEAGLYTALAAMLVYPLLGSSRPLCVSTTSAIAMLTAAQVAASSSQISGVEATTVAASLAFLVGGFLILARLLRLGFLANFISLPVLIGFKGGVGVVILIGQLKSVLGVKVVSKTPVGTLLELPGLLMHTQLATMVVSLVGVLILLGLPRFFPRLSAPLVWVVLSIAVSAAFGLEAFGVQLVGAVPSGVPALALPDLTLLPFLWPAALGIALMSFTESVAAARSFCERNDTAVNANSELLAIGAANVASALVGGLPAGGGTSQTAVANKAGVRSQMAQWVNLIVVVITLLFLSKIIGMLPKAALGSLIVVVAISMIQPETFRAIARIRLDEFIWALVTFFGVIFVGTLHGILIAVIISILTLLYQANHPPVYAVAYNREKAIFRPAGENDDDVTFPKMIILRTEGRLTFANIENARAKMQALAEQSQPEVIVLECSAIPDIEYTALMMLIEIEESLRARGITLWLAAVNPGLLKTIKRSPLWNTLKHDRMFFNLHKALEAWQQSYNMSK